MKYLSIIFLVLTLILVSSCDTENDEAISQRDIRNLMYGLSQDFNLGNVYGMLDRVHNEYLHKGQITYHLNQEILDRRARFQLLDIEVIYIEFRGDRHAIVHSRDHYQSSDENISFSEPEASGIFSYLVRDRGQWLIYGNQLWLK